MLTLTAIGALARALVYAVECWLWPFGPCPRCEGSGRRRSLWDGHWGDCRKCRGSGRRLRWGRWAWNAWRRRRSG